MAATKPTESPTKPDEPQDVLVYLDSEAAIRASYSVDRRVGGRTFTPGLSLVSAHHWPAVQGSAAWAKGKVALRVVPVSEAAALVAKTTDVAALERLGRLPALAKPVAEQMRKLRPEPV